MNQHVSASVVRDLLDYCRETGKFTWRRAPNPYARGIKPGAVAGSKTGRGYISIKINGRQYPAHRLAWLHVHGEWPPSIIDHKDRNRSNNRLNNLRLATNSLNQVNSVKAKPNSFGFKGVRRQRDGFVAQIGVDGRRLISGKFSTPQAAADEYRRMQRQYHGEFALV